MNIILQENHQAARATLETMLIDTTSEEKARQNRTGAKTGEQVVGRFAPSPTGPLHAGSLVAALGSYLLARQPGGKWLLRIEDLDTPRVVPGIADDMMRTLDLLGFEWDGEVIWQSRRGETYREALALLDKKGVLFPCGCSRKEIASAASAPHPGEENGAYPGTCRGGIPEGKRERSVRLRVEESETIVFHDRLMGTGRQRLSVECGDFVVKRADGPVAYHLAVVIDDAASGINQVVRGADLFSSTPRQIYLQRLLGFSSPSYCHLPLVTGPGGAKLSKRECAVSISSGKDLRRDGGRVLTAALRFLGQVPPESLSCEPADTVLAWALENFDLRRVPLRPAPFPQD
jgi:glutamyl-Q tRNA(Asp) synthetase